MAGTLERKIGNAGMESELITYPKTLEAMRSFIESRNGSVRFDDYMAEHLFGEPGFYSRRVDINKTGGDFVTTALEPEFARLLFRYLEGKGLGGKDFLELGGGEGSFKRNFLALSPETRYLSVEISPKLAALQKGVADNGRSQVIRADSVRLPFKNNSIEGVIFSNELLDALPCRVFKIGVGEDGVKISSEAFIDARGDNLKLIFRGVERDAFVIEYEKFLNEIQPERDMRYGDVVSISPGIRTLLEEINRVLKKGTALMFDYGFAQGYVTMGKGAKELPYFRGNRGEDSIEKIIARPYETDITYQIDFDYCRWVAKKINPEISATVDPRHHLIRTILRKNPELSPGKSRIDMPSREGVLILGK